MALYRVVIKRDDEFGCNESFYSVDIINLDAGMEHNYAM